MLKVNRRTSFLVLVFFFWNKSFFVFILLWYNFFLIFQDTVWQLSHLDVFIVVPFISSTGLVIIAEAEMGRGDFLSEKSCRHKLVVSTSFWSWLLKFLQFWHLWKTQRPFCGFYCVVDMLAAHGSSGFRLWFLCYWNMSLLCSSLMRFFVVQVFSFSRTVFG